MNISDENSARKDLIKAVETRNPETIARTVVANVWPLYTAHYELLVEAVMLLPASLLERFPVLRLLHPLTPVLARTTQLFKPLLYPDDARAMSPDELDLLTVVQIIAFRMSGDVAAAMIYSRRLEERIRSPRPDLRGQAAGPLWYFRFQIGSTLLAAGLSAGALQELATARQLCRYSGQPYTTRMVQAREALAHAVRGSHVAADRALQEARSNPEPTIAHRAANEATEGAAAALLTVERMLPEAEDVLTILDTVDSYELSWPFALLAQVRVLLALHRPDHALEMIRIAGDAHPAQHGAVATDILTATSIEAMLALGDTKGAGRIGERHASPGIFTRVALVRLALHEGRFEVAARSLGELRAEPGLAPAQRVECVHLSAWLEWAHPGRLEPELANQIFEMSRDGTTRRLLATMPCQMIDQVRELLPPESAQQFSEVTRGLRFTNLRPRPVLTTGEQRVLNALPRYGTIAEIAEAFHVSPNTIKTQVRALYRKLGSSTREEAISAAMRLHMIGSDNAEAIARVS